MDWKVVAQGGTPSSAGVDALIGLTGLLRGEVLLALGRGTLVAASGLSEDRAQELGDRLSRDPGITCRILPDSDDRPSGPRFTVLLSGFAPGYRTRLRRKLQELTGLPPEQVVVWLSRMPFALSRSVDGETARRIRNMVTAAGGVVTVEAEKKTGQPSSRGAGSAVFAPRNSPTLHSGPAPGDASRHPLPTLEASSLPPEAGASEPEPPEIPSEPVLSASRPVPDPRPRVVETGEPPILATPAGLSAEPPPRPGGWSPAAGMPVRTPPPVFAPGCPPSRASVPLPPRRKPASSRIAPEAPCEFLFSPPPSMVPGTPGIVGERKENRPVTGPSPEVILLHAPLRMIPAWMLLPSLIEPLPGTRTDPAEAPVGEEGPPPVLARRGGAPEALRSGLPEPDPEVPITESVADPCDDPVQMEKTPPPVEDGPPAVDGLFAEPDPAPLRAPVLEGRGMSEAPPVIVLPVPGQPDLPEASPTTPSDDSTGQPCPPRESAVQDSAGERDAAVRRARGRARRRSGVLPVPAPPPPAGREAPPGLASVHLYVCSPSPGRRDLVEAALTDVLGLPRETASELLERCPAWLAGFRSTEKAAEVQGTLERRGVTVARTKNLLSATDRGRNPSTKGFHAWLSSDG